MKATDEQMRKALHDYIRAWATRDKALLLSLYAEDGEMEDPAGAPPFKGHAEIGRFFDFAFPDDGRQVEPKLKDVRLCGNRGIINFIMQVRLPEKRQALDLSVIDHVEFDDAGKFKRLSAFWDEGSVSVPDGWDLFSPNIDEAYN